MTLILAVIAVIFIALVVLCLSGFVWAFGKILAWISPWIAGAALIALLLGFGWVCWPIIIVCVAIFFLGKMSNKS